MHKIICCREMHYIANNTEHLIQFPSIVFVNGQVYADAKSSELQSEPAFLARWIKYFTT